jgi:alpha-galactosidase
MLDEPVQTSLLPEHGFGFFGHPAILGARGERDWATAFALRSVEERSDGVLFDLYDPVAGLDLRLEIRLDRECDVVQRRATLTNRDAAPYRLDWLAATAEVLPQDHGEVLAFDGGWCREFETHRMALKAGAFLRENRRGRTSHDSFPGLVVGAAGFDDSTGVVYGFHLGWSGNHRLLVEVQPDGSRLVQLGELLLPGEVILARDASYRTPWCYAALAEDGLNGLSDRFHRFLRQSILPPSVAARPRPVHFNSWEAIYFDHDLAALKEIAERCADLGVERFVLDDGWFLGRDDTTSSLGDWHADPDKYPGGLGPLIDHVTALGMEFGLWVEPEMINPESELYRRHPDWALHLEGRERPTCRNQLALDLSRDEVADYLFNELNELLRHHGIGYLKWDHNRDLAPAASRGRPSTHTQTLGFYRLLDRLRAAHPNLEIESCAAGGARIDYEVMKRCERFWTSDSNDALQRQAIQRGCSLFFPPEVMGAHLGPAVCHTSNRRLPLNFRARTALFGHFGIEMDPRDLGPEEASELKQHIGTFKRFRGLLHSGRLFRLSAPGGCGYLSVSQDGAEALGAMASLNGEVPAQSQIRLPGLQSHAHYRVRLVEPLPTTVHTALARPDQLTQEGITVAGRTIAEAGLDLPPADPPSILLFHLLRL